MTEKRTNGNPQLSLSDVLRDTMTAAKNRSWSETDKLYVSVCSALVALAAIFGHPISGSDPSMALVGVLVLLLSINWMFLIKRYRQKILAALERLAIEHKDSDLKNYYDGEKQRFKDGKRDYYIAWIVLLLSLVVIFSPIACGLHEKFCA